MKIWHQIKQWRHAKRAELLERRLAVPRERRAHVSSVIMERIFDQVPDIGGAIIGFYWPIKGELDMRELVTTCLLAGAKASLPVVVEKNRPVQFWSWTLMSKMTPGFWNIPVPEKAEIVNPTILLVPLVGFDASGYRLGYGGGYYDRTLAALSPKPITIGVGYECGRLASIYPQSHDIPMDATVTESEFKWHEASMSDGCRSSLSNANVH